jgi:hypothetical protein
MRSSMIRLRFPRCLLICAARLHLIDRVTNCDSA